MNVVLINTNSIGHNVLLLRNTILDHFMKVTKIFLVILCLDSVRYI